MTFSPAPKHLVQTLFEIGSLDYIGAARALTTPASAAYPLANLAFYIPFSVSIPCTAMEGYTQAGTVAGGNFDIGVYDAAGVRLSSSGSTARSASSIINTTTFTNLELLPDRYYYMAFAADSTNTYLATVPAAAICEAFGVLESTTSFVLPTNPTLAVTTRAYIPYFGLNLKATAF